MVFGGRLGSDVVVAVGVWFCRVCVVDRMLSNRAYWPGRRVGWIEWLQQRILLETPRGGLQNDASTEIPNNTNQTLYIIKGILKVLRRCAEVLIDPRVWGSVR